MTLSDTKMTGTTTTARRIVLRPFVVVAFAFVLVMASASFSRSAHGQTSGQQQGKSSTQKAQEDQAAKDQTGTETPASAAAPAEHEPTSIGGELAKETREAEGEEPEEHGELKHSTMVQKLAKLTGMSVHGAHLVALIVNFIIIAGLLIWALRKTMPSVFRARTDSIQRALEEARRASQEARQRLSDIESRLQQMDAEIGRMQASAEKEAEGEEDRIRKAAEDDLRKVVAAAEQEIAAAAKQVRRELSVYTADLALTLARKQINVDSNTDQVLVRNFAAKLAEPSSSDEGHNGGRDGGKGGR